MSHFNAVASLKRGVGGARSTRWGVLSWPRLSIGAATIAVLIALVVPASAATASTKNTAAPAAPAGQAPLPVRNGSAHSLGAYNPGQTVRLAVGLQPSNTAAEQQYLAAIQDKSSPLFHAYLTQPEWTARFGPSVAAQQAVVSWAEQAGLTVTQLYANRLVVDLAGTVGNVEKALGVQINSYRLGSSSFFANDKNPVVPAGLRGTVVSIDGLSSMQTMFPASAGLSEPASPAYVAGPVVANGAHAAANGSHAALVAAQRASGGTTSNITNGAYDPTDIYSSEAYDYNALYNQGHCCNPLGNVGSSPPQTSIAIATFGSQSISDIQGFQGQYPYLAYNVQEVYIDGTPACCDAEGTMDAEWSTATSNSFGGYQNTSKVYLYDGANFNDSTFTDIYNTMVSQNVARVFSTSWSCTEFYGCTSSEMTTRDAIFSEMTGQGWTLVAASGDRGAYDDCAHLAVSFPASDPNVVGAGGTEMALSSGPVFDSQTAWSGGPDGCSSNDGGSGGGCSSMFAAPAFQSDQPCGSTSRAVPDISLNADWYHTPQNLFFGGSLSGNGGTSIVAPELAGFFAQEDSYLLSAGSICGSGSSACAPLGNANYPLYETGIDGAPHNPYYDITTGCNTNDIGPGYCAGTGYDVVTGWGSANMLQLAWAFNWHLFVDDGRPDVNFSGPTPGTWYRTDQTVGISVADTGGGFPASGVAGFSDAWNVDPGDPTSAATPGAGNSFYNGPEYVNSTSGSLDLAAEGQGCHTVNVEAWDNMGLQSGDATDGPLCYDTVPPVITAKPTVTMTSHAGMTGGFVPLTVSWKATDAESGVSTYTLYQSKNGGSFVKLSTGSASSYAVEGVPGNTYRFEVSATDNAGNTSAPSAGATYTLTAYQENSSSVTYSSGWARQAVSGAYGGAVDYATVAGKTATLHYTGVQVAWISTVGPTRGAAKVSLDGGTPVSIATHATTAKSEQLVYVVSKASGAHTIVVTVAGTPTADPRIDIDAFIVLSV